MAEYFYFRVDTAEGRFYPTIDAEAHEQAEQMARNIFERFELPIQQLRTLKRHAGAETQSVLLWDRGTRLNAGRDFWYAVGKGEEFETIMKEQHV